VLRRIMRRAARHGKKLGLAKRFVHCRKGGGRGNEGVYPEITRSLDYIVRVVLTEEENFSTTLEAGLKILQEEVDALHKAKSASIP